MKKMVFRVFLYIKLTFRWLQAGLSDLKNTKQLKFAYGIFFTHFKNVAFFNFFSRFFEIHQYFLVKLLNVLNFI